MKLEGDYRFEASVQEVWDAMFDPVILAAVLPGCEKLELVGGQLVGEMKIKVGPVQGKFAGKVELLDRQEPRSYRMIVDGRGAPGFVKASATVTLEAEDGGTRIRYDADAQVGGKIASVGQRLLEASSRAIVAQSLDGLHANIKLRAAAHREAAAKAPEAPMPDAMAAPDLGAPAPEPAPPSAPELAAALASPAIVDAETAAPAAAPAPAAPTRPVVEFTPIKADPSALARGVAKEVARTMFPRSVLVAIIVVQSAVIAWLLLR
jgi:carbon monoxide dehydrogenase subunit G